MAAKSAHDTAIGDVVISGTIKFLLCNFSCEHEQHQFETLLIITHLARIISMSWILNLSDLLHYKCVYVYIFSWISRISTFVPFSTFCLWAIVQLCTYLYLFCTLMYTLKHWTRFDAPEVVSLLISVVNVLCTTSIQFCIFLYIQCLHPLETSRCIPRAIINY